MSTPTQVKAAGLATAVVGAIYLLIYIMVNHYLIFTGMIIAAVTALVWYVVFGAYMHVRKCEEEKRQNATVLPPPSNP